MHWIYKTLITLGIVIALVPALGFPARWENTFLVIAGIGIIALAAFQWWRERTAGKTSDHGGTGSLFSQSVGQTEHNREERSQSYHDGKRETSENTHSDTEVSNSTHTT